ncbi:MAG TPA: LolA-related protein [Povalibacter sp.]|nr:LolA-related protein [Povalibacter sp.]
MLLPTLAPMAAQLDAADAKTLISQLAKPTPATIDFSEIRFSPLLKQPLIVSGTLGYQGSTSLDRHVTRPYRETTEIRGDSVLVRREGEPERSFGLKRAPELQGLLSAFTSLLAGDHAAVEREFTIDAAGDSSAWRILLAPRDARLSRRVKLIRIEGRNDAPRCFSIIGDNNGASVMLLGATAHAELPKPVTREWLERFCSQPNE